jgi:hypothetical protein
MTKASRYNETGHLTLADLAGTLIYTKKIGFTETFNKCTKTRDPMKERIWKRNRINESSGGTIEKRA